MENVIIFGGSANQELLLKICRSLNMHPGKALIGKFPDGETKVEIRENVREKNVFIIQPTSPPVNDNLMELLAMIDALKRASARSVTAVISYYGYARQDRKHKGRVPITARLVADLIEVAGADRILTIDLHAPQIQGFFKIPVDHFPGYLAFKNGFQEQTEDLVVVAPDTGSIERAGAFAKKLKVPLAVIDKRRIDERRVEVRNVIGTIKEKTVLLADDIISTGGTVVRDTEALIKKGAKRVIVCATHGVFSSEAKNLLDNSDIEKIYITDSVKSIFPLPERVIYEHSVASLLGEGIFRISEGLSVGEIIEHT